jgi:hypothetical protein
VNKRYLSRIFIENIPPFTFRYHNGKINFIAAVLNDRVFCTRIINSLIFAGNKELFSCFKLLFLLLIIGDYFNINTAVRI